MNNIFIVAEALSLRAFCCAVPGIVIFDADDVTAVASFLCGLVRISFLLGRHGPGPTHKEAHDDGHFQHSDISNNGPHI